MSRISPFLNHAVSTLSLLILPLFLSLGMLLQRDVKEAISARRISLDEYGGLCFLCSSQAAAYLAGHLCAAGLVHVYSITLVLLTKEVLGLSGLFSLKSISCIL